MRIRMWESLELRVHGPDSTSGPWQVCSDQLLPAIWLAEVKAQGDYDIGLENKMYEVSTGTNLTKVVYGQDLPSMLHDLEN